MEVAHHQTIHGSGRFVHCAPVTGHGESSLELVVVAQPREVEFAGGIVDPRIDELDCCCLAIYIDDEP